MKTNQKIKYLFKSLNISILFFFISCEHFKTHKSMENKKNTKLLQTQISLAQNHLNKGNYQESLTIAKNLEKNFPEDEDVLNTLGLNFLALNNLSKASYYFKKAYQQNSKIGIALNLSSTYIAANELDKAKKILHVLSTNKTYDHPERIYHNLALIFEKEKKYVEAEKLYKKALTEHPVYYLSMFNLAGVYLKLNRKNEAYASYLKSVEFCKSCYEPVKIIAINYINNGKYKKAKRILTSYLTQKKISSSDKQHGNRLLKIANSQLKKT